jgi:DNA-binding MarR family transcriptional regulator
MHLLLRKGAKARFSTPILSELMCDEDLNYRFSNEHFIQIGGVLLNDLHDGKLQPIDICVYAALYSHSGSNIGVWPGIERIAKGLGVSKASVDRSLRRLVHARHISRSVKSKFNTRVTKFLTRIEGGKVVCERDQGLSKSERSTEMSNASDTEESSQVSQTSAPIELYEDQDPPTEDEVSF